MTAAKKILPPLLEILTLGSLFISIFGAILIKAFIYSQAEPAGNAYALTIRFAYALKNGLLAIALLLGFVSLLVLPFKKKLVVATLMISAAFLTRGLLS